jgi:hypothetical protein
MTLAENGARGMQTDRDEMAWLADRLHLPGAGPVL